MISPPMRLLDEPGLGRAERDLLEVGTRRAPIDYDVGAGALRFRAGVAALSAAGVATGAAHAAHAATAANSGTGVSALVGKLSLKLAIAVVLPLVGAGVAVNALVGSGAPPLEAGRSAHRMETWSAAEAPSRKAPAAHGASDITPVEEPREISARPAPRQIPSEEPAAGPAPRSRIAGSAAAPAAPAMAVHLEETVDEPASEQASRAARPDVAPARPDVAPAASNAALEMQGIARAKALLARDPAAAAAALEALRRAHPNGFFVEERRALTVLALARAGNRIAAREQGAAFLARYPNGPFTDQVRAAISR